MSIRITFLYAAEAHVVRDMPQVPAVGDEVEIAHGSFWRVAKRFWRRPVDMFSDVDVIVEPLDEQSVWPKTTVKTKNDFPTRKVRKEKRK